MTTHALRGLVGHSVLQRPVAPAPRPAITLDAINTALTLQPVTRRATVVGLGLDDGRSRMRAQLVVPADDAGDDHSLAAAAAGVIRSAYGDVLLALRVDVYRPDSATHLDVLVATYAHFDESVR